MGNSPLGDRRVRAAAAGLVVLTVVGGTLLAGQRGGYPVSRPHLLSGAAWLPSGPVGQLALLDGASGEIAAQVQVTPHSERLDVAQQGTTAYAVSRSSGWVRRVDGATFEVTPPVSPLPDAHDGLQVLAGTDQLYVLDTERGLFTTADPSTVASSGRSVPLAARVAPDAAVIDGSGRLWILDDRTGDLVWISNGRRSMRRNAARPDHAMLVLADGAPVIVDSQARTATMLDPATGEGRAEATLDLRPDDRVHVGGSPHDTRIYLVASRGLLILCDLGASGCATGISLGTADGDFGVPVEAGGRIFVPDYTTGQVYIVDPRESHVLASPQVLPKQTHFQLLTRDGIVFFNDPNSQRAGVIRVDGGVKPVAKYDPADPDRGLTGRHDDDGRQTPTSSPSPSGDPSSPAPPSPCPTVQIALSRTTAQVGEDIAFRADNSGGAGPTSVEWTFGDGQAANGDHTVHRWTAARTYQVNVRETFPGCPAVVASVAVQVKAPASKATLTVTVTGKGTVTSRPGGISCPPACSAVFVAGTVVELTGQPIGATQQFDGWSGACAGSGPTSTCRVTIRAGGTAAGAAFRDGGPQHRVLGVQVTMKGTQPPARTCPLNVSFSGRITVSGGPVTVRYTWVWSDGTTGPTGSLDFTSAGMLTADADHGFTTSGSHWAVLRILSPNGLDSARGNVTITCITANRIQVTGVNPSPYTGSCTALVNIQIFLRIDSLGPGTVRYTTVWSDGYVAPEQTFTFIRGESLQSNAWRQFPAGSTGGTFTFRGRAIFSSGTVFSAPVSFRMTCT